MNKEQTCYYEWMSDIYRTSSHNCTKHIVLDMVWCGLESYLNSYTNSITDFSEPRVLACFQCDYFNFLNRFQIFNLFLNLNLGYSFLVSISVIMWCDCYLVLFSSFLKFEFYFRNTEVGYTVYLIRIVSV